MTLHEVYFPDPLFDILVLLAGTFKRDLNDLIVELLRTDVEAIANNDFEDLVEPLKKEVKEYLKAFDNLPE